MPEYTTRIGHAHLKVRDLKRSIDFYTRYFNLKITEQIGNQMVFLSGGEMHHELALQALGDDAYSPNPYAVGLYHVAFEVPDRRAFAQAYFALKNGGVPVTPVNHRISWAMYFNDPDGNGLEIYADTRTFEDGAEDWQAITVRLPESQIAAMLEADAATPQSDGQ